MLTGYARPACPAEVYSPARSVGWAHL